MTIHSVKVLSKDVSAGGRYPKTVRSGGITFSRRDATPDALSKNPAKITWWEKEFDDPKTKGQTPVDPQKKRVAILPFPEFDVSEYSWDCHFVLQSNMLWVGQYDGVKPKPLGEAPGTHNVSDVSPDQKWIHFQFRSEIGLQYFSKKACKLITGNDETFLYIPDLKGDGEFHGFAAHCQSGSIYRPEENSKIVLEWGNVSKWDADHKQTIQLPKFSSKAKNWYCYFTLGKDEKWTAVYEGVETEK